MSTKTQLTSMEVAFAFPCYVVVAMEMKEYINEVLKDPSPFLLNMRLLDCDSLGRSCLVKYHLTTRLTSRFHGDCFAFFWFLASDTFTQIQQTRSPMKWMCSVMMGEQTPLILLLLAQTIIQYEHVHHIMPRPTGCNRQFLYRQMGNSLLPYQKWQVRFSHQHQQRTVLVMPMLFCSLFLNWLGVERKPGCRFYKARGWATPLPVQKVEH